MNEYTRINLTRALLEEIELYLSEQAKFDSRGATDLSALEDELEFIGEAVSQVGIALEKFVLAAVTS